MTLVAFALGVLVVLAVLHGRRVVASLRRRWARWRHPEPVGEWCCHPDCADADELREGQCFELAEHYVEDGLPGLVAGSTVAAYYCRRHRPMKATPYP